MSRQTGGIIESGLAYIIGENPTTTFLPCKPVVVPGAINGAIPVMVVVRAEGVNEQRSELELHSHCDHLAQAGRK